MSIPNPEQEVERLSQIIENLNFVIANQSAELSMKNGHLAHAKEIYIEAVRQRDELRGWKDSAMAQLNKLDVIAIGKLLALPIGVDVMPTIQPAIEKLVQENEVLRHGSLTDPLLKATVDPLFKEIEELKVLLANLNAEIEECRDNILHERHQLEGGVLDSDQINAVLGVFDDSITQPVAFVCDSCKARVGKVTNGDCDVCRFEGPRATPAAPVDYNCVCGTCRKSFVCRIDGATMCDDCCPF